MEKDLVVKEVQCKTIISKSRLYDTDYSINPYCGCLHACVYCLHPEMEILTNKGFLKISELVNNTSNTSVITHEGRFQPILNHFKHNYNGNLISIIPYCLGKKIKITPNHKILAIKRKDMKCLYSHYICYTDRKESYRSLKGKKVRFSCKYCKAKRIWKPAMISAEQLNKGDFLSVPISKEIQDIKVIKISDILKDIKVKHSVGKGRKLSKGQIKKIFYFKNKGFSQIKIAKKLNISRSTVYIYLSGKRKAEIGYTSFLLTEGKYVRFKGGKKRVPHIIRLNNDFFRLVGYYLTEGCVSKAKDRPNSYILTISFHENEKQYIKDVQDIFNKIFDINPSIYHIKKDKVVHICISNTIISLLFSKLFGCDSSSMKIPSQFLFLPHEKQKELLKGALRGDGSKIDEPLYVTTSSILARQFLYILTRLHIVPHLSYASNRKGIPFYEIRATSKFKNAFAKLWGENIKKVKERNFFVCIDDNHIFVPIRNISKEFYNGPVYNLSINKDKTYTCNLVAVSNCYAPLVLREKRKWGNFIDVKTNAPEILEKQLKKIKSGNILISSVTDPYNPLERRYQITRKILEKLKDKDFFVSILTKSNLVLRDVDLLKQMKCEVGVTITTFNEEARKVFEPNTISSEERLKVLDELKKQGIKTYVFFGPLLPYISDVSLEKTIEKFAGVKPFNIFVDRLNVKSSYQWKIIEKVLEKNYPQLLNQWKDVLFSKNDYYEKLKEKIVELCRSFNLNYEICY